MPTNLPTSPPLLTFYTYQHTNQPNYLPNYLPAYLPTDLPTHLVSLSRASRGLPAMILDLRGQTLVCFGSLGSGSDKVVKV